MLIDQTPVDVVVGCLALHVLVEKPKHYVKSESDTALETPLSTQEAYEQLFHLIYKSLKIGGHFIFADHVGQLPLYQQLRLMEKVGFIDVDCAWRQDEYFVAGGYKPPTMTLQL